MFHGCQNAVTELSAENEQAFRDNDARGVKGTALPGVLLDLCLGIRQLVGFIGTECDHHGRVDDYRDGASRRPRSHTLLLLSLLANSPFYPSWDSCPFGFLPIPSTPAAS